MNSQCVGIGIAVFSLGWVIVENISIYCKSMYHKSDWRYIESTLPLCGDVGNLLFIK